MKTLRQMFLGFMLLIAGSAAFSPAALAAEGKYYTKVNIWYEKPEKIMSTNYHKGAMIPVGSEVDVIKSSGKAIQFRDKASGTEFRIKLVKDFTNLNEQEFFERYFSKDNVLDSSEFNSLSAMEKENVKAGTLREGMSKKAVLMAYGFPPSHRTPSTESSTWVYWKSRLINFTAVFKDDKLVAGGF